MNDYTIKRQAGVSDLQVILLDNDNQKLLVVLQGAVGQVWQPRDVIRMYVAGVNTAMSDDLFAFLKKDMSAEELTRVQETRIETRKKIHAKNINEARQILSEMDVAPEELINAGYCTNTGAPADSGM